MILLTTSHQHRGDERNAKVGEWGHCLLVTGVRSRSEILCLGVESDERRHPERDALGDTKGLQALGDFLIALPFRMATTRPLWMLSRTKPSSLWSSRLLSGKLDRRASATNWRMPELPI